MKKVATLVVLGLFSAAVLSGCCCKKRCCHEYRGCHVKHHHAHHKACS